MRPEFLRCGGRGRQPPPALRKTKRLAPLGLRKRTRSAYSRAHKGHVPCERHFSPRRRRKTKRTAQMTVRSTLILASGMAKPTGSGTYVSDLACRNRAGITVTLSRGLSPHSVARLPKDRRAVRCFHLSNGSIAHKNPDCKGLPAPASRFSRAVLPPGYSAVRTRRSAPRPALFFSRQVKLAKDFLVVLARPVKHSAFRGCTSICWAFPLASPFFQPPAPPPLGAASAASQPCCSGIPVRRCRRAAES